MSRSSLAIALALCLWAGLASAHTRSVSYSFWETDDGGARARATVSQLELTRLGLAPGEPQYRDRVAQRLMDGLRLHHAGGACTNKAALPPDIADGNVVHRWRASCDGAPTGITATLFREAGVAHTYFVTLRREGEAPATRVLTAPESAWHWARDGESAAPPDRFAAFLVLGVEHILTGWDHLVFLLALVVIAASLKEVAWLATGFTLGHSLTLGIAVLGIARPAAPAVEAFIALSIVLVALENAWRLDRSSRPFAVGAAVALLGLALLSAVMPLLVVLGLALFLLAYGALLADARQGFRLRLALTVAFGLFHGFGFAGVLGGMALPDDRLVLALLGFNLGVEAGQLLLLALAWPALLALRGARWPVAPAATAAAGGIGVFWYVQRLFG